MFNSNDRDECQTKDQSVVHTRPAESTAVQDEIWDDTNVIDARTVFAAKNATVIARRNFRRSYLEIFEQSEAQILEEIENFPEEIACVLRADPSLFEFADWVKEHTSEILLHETSRNRQQVVKEYDEWLFWKDLMKSLKDNPVKQWLAVAVRDEEIDWYLHQFKKN